MDKNENIIKIEIPIWMEQIVKKDPLEVNIKSVWVQT